MWKLNPPKLTANLRMSVVGVGLGVGAAAAGGAVLVVVIVKVTMLVIGSEVPKHVNTS